MYDKKQCSADPFQIGCGSSMSTNVLASSHIASWISTTMQKMRSFTSKMTQNGDVTNKLIICGHFVTKSHWEMVRKGRISTETWEIRRTEACKLQCYLIIGASCHLVLLRIWGCEHRWPWPFFTLHHSTFMNLIPHDTQIGKIPTNVTLYF